MAYTPSEAAEPQVLNLAQLAKSGTWQLALVHDRAEHLLVWVTRGQGVALLDGHRAGFGSHNAIFVPSRTLMALDLGRQTYGQAVLIPAGTPLNLPNAVTHLRVRDAAAQSELTVLLEAMGREQAARRPLFHEAVFVHAELLAIWMRRQAALSDPPDLPTSAQRLTRAYCRRLVDAFSSGATVAEHAAALGVSPAHLSRACRAETSRTAADLLSERLVHAARGLLTGTTIQVQDIARHLGFGSAGSFTRFVRQHTGKSPSDLRKAAQSNR